MTGTENDLSLKRFIIQVLLIARLVGRLSSGSKFQAEIRPFDGCRMSHSGDWPAKYFLINRLVKRPK